VVDVVANHAKEPIAPCGVLDWFAICWQFGSGCHFCVMKKGLSRLGYDAVIYIGDWVPLTSG